MKKFCASRAAAALMWRLRRLVFKRPLNHAYACYVRAEYSQVSGVYSNDLRIPLSAIAAGLGDHTIVTTLCPGGKERMRRLIAVIASGRIDLRSLVTHRFKLDEIEAAYELFANQRDGVLKVAITP